MQDSVFLEQGPERAMISPNGRIRFNAWDSAQCAWVAVPSPSPRFLLMAEHCQAVAFPADEADDYCDLAALDEA